MAFHNSQLEPPPCVYEIFYDLPHPGASSATERAQIIDPPRSSYFDPDTAAEFYEPQNIARVARFAFPEFNDLSHEPASYHLNKFDIHFDEHKSSYHTFSIKVAGTRFLAHVLRYLPVHPEIKRRYDMGRRCERAYILLTRAIGGENFYADILRTIQGVVLEGFATPYKKDNSSVHAKKFLHTVFNTHFKLCEEYKSSKSKPKSSHPSDYFVTLRINHIEYNDVKLDDQYFSEQSDHIIYMLPQSLQPHYIVHDYFVHLEDIHSPILPLLRCLGVSHTLRVLSALLCERKIIFLSNDIEILSACVHASTSILAQGLLIWRHVQIPILPYHLFHYLSEETAFIVGMLSKYSDKLETISGLKDTLCVDLDSNLLRTFNMPNPSIAIPDLLLQNSKKGLLQSENSSLDLLIRNLMRALADDEALWMLDGDDSAGRKEKEASMKQSIISKLFGKGIMISKVKSTLRRSSNFSERSADISKDEKCKSKTPTSVTTFVNEAVEVHLKAYFTCFFLELYGDMGMYLSISPTDGSFLLDKQKFLVRKKQLGTNETSSMYVLLRKLARSKMFEKFCLGRVRDMEELSEGIDLLSEHTPLFALCERELRKLHKKFTPENIRTVLIHILSGKRQNKIISHYKHVREQVISMTSEKTVDGSSTNHLKKIINDCRNNSTLFHHVMIIIMLRFDEIREFKWKRHFLSLHIMKNFLLNGPLICLSHFLILMNKVQILRNLPIKNSEAKDHLHGTAQQVYLLLTDFSQLFMRRRKAFQRKMQQDAIVKSGITLTHYLMQRLPISINFHQLHGLLGNDDDLSTAATKIETSANDRTIFSSEESKRSMDQTNYSTIGNFNDGISYLTEQDQNSQYGDEKDRNEVLKPKILLVPQTHSRDSMADMGAKVQPKRSSITSRYSMTDMDTKVQPKRSSISSRYSMTDMDAKVHPKTVSIPNDLSRDNMTDLDANDQPKNSSIPKFHPQDNMTEKMEILPEANLSQHHKGATDTEKNRNVTRRRGSLLV